ncbi:ATP-binding protein [Streptomyces sp. DT24]|uniref:ATP-binding protein n=1 Tax=Streptomyces sp. DT24 TaxID=3416520 RepID=UPI003CF97609
MTLTSPSVRPDHTGSDTAVRFPVLPTPSAVRSARGRVLSQLRAWGLGAHEEFAYDVLVTLSELLTNAVVHGRGSLTVGLDLDFDRLIVEVFDQNDDEPRAGGAGPDGESGRGLSVIGSLALAQGCERLSRGKRCWAVLDVPRYADAVPLHAHSDVV